MSAKKNIIIIGGAHGGPSAAIYARLAHAYAKIILIEQEKYISWAHPSDQERYNIETRTETKAISLDLDVRVVIIKYRGKIERLEFDAIIYAGGAISKSLDIQELVGPRVTNYRNAHDLEIIHQAKLAGAKQALVVGCGLYGLEAALGLKSAGFDVSMLEINQRIFPKFSVMFSEVMRDKLTSLGIKIRLGTKIIKAHEKLDKSFELELSSLEKINTDLVVICVGITPRTNFLSEAGAALDDDNTIRVDNHMATTLPNIYACGSVVSVPHAVTKLRQWIPEPGVILRSAQVAARNAVLNHDQPKDAIKFFAGTIITKIGLTKFARTGLADHEANIFSTTVFSPSHDMCVRILVDKKTNHIVGGEVFGEHDVERLIDLIAICVTEGFSADKLTNLDIACDLLKEAAMRAKNNINDESQIITADKLALWLAKNQDFNLVNITGDMAIANLRDKLTHILKNNLPVVLYSQSGYLSLLALQVLNQSGLANIYHLAGGQATLDLVTAEK